jgi:hypothetical protein
MGLVLLSIIPRYLAALLPRVMPPRVEIDTPKIYFMNHIQRGRHRFMGQRSTIYQSRKIVKTLIFLRRTTG